MHREHLLWIGVFITILICGLLIGQNTWREPTSGSQVEANSFRQWFWQSRTLDLAAQVGLIFGGALGIAALLPGDREEE